MILKELEEKGLISPPSWLSSNTMYVTIMGSTAYGVSSDTSDMDLYGWCIPKKSVVFPHLDGEVQGFGRQKQRFDQWQEHHVVDHSAMAGHGRSYDLQIFNIVKFFHLLMENNPNIIDSIFTPANCVLHCTQIGNRVREQRRIFLHKGSFFKMKGYAFSQLHKMSSKDPHGKRLELVEAHGYDTKFAYHIFRLLDEARQILMEGDLDLQRNREELKSIRRGEWTEEEIRKVAADRERQLEKVYEESTLRHSPDEAAIKALLLECLEAHYGSLEKCVVTEDRVVIALRNIQAELDKVRGAF